MANVIRVVLQSDLSNLGATGEVVRVRPGYARNYLLPRGLAVPATPGNLARVEEIKASAAARAQKLEAEAKGVAQKLGAASVKIARQVGAEGKMYGSVTSRDIEEAFAAQGLIFDRKKLELAEPIKALGSFELPLKLHANVTATVKVEVTAPAGRGCDCGTRGLSASVLRCLLPRRRRSEASAWPRRRVVVRRGKRSSSRSRGACRRTIST
jgi:large subunit ribosomal protein L9